MLDCFPEIARKPIIVIELSTRGSHTGILTALRPQAKARPTIEVLSLRVSLEDFFRFDGHLNPRGHATVADQLHPAIERALRRRD